MKPPHFVRVAGPWLAAVALAMPLAVLAQTAASNQETDWRRANEAVGNFKRGHADVLKWEKAHMPAEADPAMRAEGPAVPDAGEAIRRAWRLHRDLVGVQSRLGTDNVARIVAGQWLDLDPGLQRRVDGMDELLDVAAQARKAWLEAVTARQMLRFQEASLEAAEAASELGRRMVSVGNWSRLQLSPVQLAEASARMNLRKARFAATQAEAALIQTMGLTGVVSSVNLPDQLPELPAEPMAAAGLQARAVAIQGQLPDAERRRNQALAGTAIEAYQAAYALATESRDVVLKEREFMTEETVLHYNGMLKSVWDLLDETRNQSQATADAVGAQRDFWLADADLQWVMQGGAPDRFVAFGGGAEAPKAAAH
ncbi:MAG: TolC family protein [Burkholderiaceae bacterium]